MDAANRHKCARTPARRSRLPAASRRRGSSGSATVELLEGPRLGERLTASVDQASDIAGSIPYNKGDEVLLTEVTDASGGAVFAVADRSRGGALLIALALFAAAVVAIAGAVGARALLALTVTGVVLVRFGIPALLSGASPWSLLERLLWSSECHPS